MRNDAVVVRPDGGGHGRLLALVVEVARDGVRGAVDVSVVRGLVLRRLLAPVRRLGQRIRLVRVAPARRRISASLSVSYLGLSDSMGDDLHEMVYEWSSELRSVLGGVLNTRAEEIIVQPSVGVREEFDSF